ncbi:site-2 protease family protein [Arenibaculum pallidiluteum]|uniref:site-2 protease family protein n=1 Tax=Arenibaculum pallidiluteum TaxID=2812559 RepID=UPI001A973468|nr:site-2 protease family protein [Arenibaculum pallidiluteum]
MTLPQLRDDLRLLEGPHSLHGAPTWTLHDPLANRYFRIGWLEFEMLSRWSLGASGAVAQALLRETTIAVGEPDVSAFARFLEDHGLCTARGPEAQARLLRQREAVRKGPLTWLLKNYLFLRLRLVRPDRFLEATLPLVAWMFSRGFLMVVGLAALLGLWLVGRQWDAFLAGFAGYASLEGAATVALVLTGVKVLHEFGHGYAARRFGCRVPAMGIAFIVLWPMLWTDTTGAWRLTSRRQRLAIDAAGIMVELALAAFASVAWALLPDGAARDAAHLLAGTTWISTLAVNVNPLMRFDGYYLISDLLDEPNLQDRAFAHGRWRLRETLFGFGDPAPEPLPRRRRIIFTLYAWVIWLYRLVVFTGIAILVYHMAFKLLGLFLFAVEMWWFVLRPIANELKVWAERRSRFRMNIRTSFLLAATCALGAVAVLPWQKSVTAQGVLQASAEALLYTPVAGRLAVPPQEGTRVVPGDLVAQLDLPDLGLRISAAEKRLEHVTAQVALASVDAEAAQRSVVAWQELEAAGAELEALRTRRAELEVRATVPGIVIDVPDHLHSGDWIAAREPVGMIVSDRALVRAYVPESELSRLVAGAAARFYGQDGLAPSVHLRLVSLAPTAARTTDDPEVASVYGGEVASHLTSQGEIQIQEAVNLATFETAEPMPAPLRAMRGHVVIEAEPVSPAGRFWRQMLGVLIRESGL